MNVKWVFGQAKPGVTEVWQCSGQQVLTNCTDVLVAQHSLDNPIYVSVTVFVELSLPLQPFCSFGSSESNVPRLVCTINCFKNLKMYIPGG